MGLEDYKDIVATAAGITTVAQCFAPAFICKTIVQRGSAKGIDPLPFIGGIVISVLMLQHGIILDDPAMIPVNIFAFGLNLSYLLCYYFYCPDKGILFTTVAKAVAFVAALIGYAQYEKPELVEFRFGMIVTVILLSLIGAPLLSLGEIIKTGNTDSLPFPLIISGTVVTSLWLLYGIIIKNMFVQVQNVTFFTLYMMQFILFIIFSYNKDEKPNEAGQEEPKPDETNPESKPDETSDATAADTAKSEDTSADAPKEDATAADSAKTGEPATDPAKTSEPTADPAKTESSTDPAKAEPAADPAKTEPATDPAKTEPTADPAKTETAADPAKTEPTADPAKTETAADPAKTETAADPAKTETAADPAKTETAADPAKTEEPPADPSKTETAADPAKTEEPAADPSKTETAADPTKTEEPAADPSKTETSTDPAKTEEPAADPAKTEPAAATPTA